MSIDSIIKQAMIDAGMNPEIEKKATGNKLADDLYALASECEKLGSARVGVKSGSEPSCLRSLTKAYLFQRMLKSAVEDRLGVVNTEAVKSAGEGEPDIRVEYLKAFGKVAMEKEAIDAKTIADIAGIAGAALVLGGLGYGGYKVVEREGRIHDDMLDTPEYDRLIDAGKQFDNSVLDYYRRNQKVRKNTPFYPKKAVGA
jgi:hypothetical protein